MDSPLLPPLALPLPADLLARLHARYVEPHRHYHDWRHVLACFEALHRLIEAPLPDVELALLFHDAVYEPLGHDNEAKSAALLVEEGRRAWLEESLLTRAARWIQATRLDSDPPALGEEACLVADADRSILAASPDHFDAYERGVRAEYAAVPDEAFRAGRERVLRGMLERDLYFTGRGRSLWESAARKNLERSLAALV